MKYKNIIWDWNGTLLDDVRVSVATINEMLTRRQLPPISVERYRELFGFPVRDYYENIGFDFEQDDWDEVSRNFASTYNSLAGTAVLTENIRAILTEIQHTGVRQYILSALEEKALNEMLLRFGIREYFDGVCGSDNIYAEGKIVRGREMLRDYSIIPVETLMVGDTLHDAEVARALGFDVRLFAKGHNCERRLRENAPVITRMEEILHEL